MEDMSMKSKKKTVFAILAAVIVLLIAVVAFTVPSLFDGSKATIYYTQIDNSKIDENDSKGGVVNFKGNLPYSYTLTSYDEKGKEKEITFGTSKELQDGVFISQEVVPVRGVTSWDEVQYEELPEAVRSKYAAPKE